jgi:hypothetical protein
LFVELIFTGAADGTDPVFWYFGKISVRGNATVRIPCGWVVDIATNNANMFFHLISPQKNG